MNKIFLNSILHIILIFFLVLLFIYLTSNKEKFNNNITSPKILKVNKNKSSVYIEWENTNKKINTFIVLYIDINDKNQAVWITNPIKCNKTKCNHVINNLFGKKYYLTVLAKLDKKTSSIDNIVYFSDDINYELKDINIKNTDLINPPIPTPNNINENNNNENNNENSNNENENNNNENNNDNNAPSIEPHFNCKEKLKRVNIKTKEELESAKLKNNCKEDKEMEEIRDLVINEKRVYDNLYEKLF